MVYGILIVALLSTWFLISAFYQLQMPLTVSIKRRDYFALIPKWTFFAPNPANTDYRLLYRDRLSDGSVTPWQEAAFCREKRLSTALWNPKKRNQKAISDLMRSLLRSFRNSNESAAALQLTLSYIGLLNIVTHLRHNEFSQFTQFAVFQTYGFSRLRNARLVMHSQFHSLT